MKTILPLLLLLLLCVSCQKKENIKGFYVTIDTLNTTLPGNVGGGVMLDNKYYMYNWDYKDFKNELGFNLERRICILSRNGKLIDTISPDSETFLFGNFLIRNDSVILNDIEMNRAYYLDEKNKEYIRLQKADYVLFEDKNYSVTSSDFGEFGGATWFKDKKTGIQYETEAVMPEIRKISGMYYLFSSEGIDVIKNPKRMPNMGKGHYGLKPDSTSFGMFYYRKKPANRLQGVRRIFEDTIPKYDNYYKSNIRTSFIHNDSLYFIFQDDRKNKTFIAKMHGKTMIPVLTLHEISIVRHLNRYKNTEERAIPFKNNITGQHGMLEIDGKNIYLHYIKNTPPE